MDCRKEKQLTAFVIMPFDKGFEEIYQNAIVTTLRKVGFAVSRADDVGNAQNILKDIVHGIAESDLIIADLTGSNPNVYYELGLAHGLRKAVILLTQDIQDLPFDLRSYRVIRYTTQFQNMDRARKQLEETALGFSTGETEFGSPTSDFLGQPTRLASQHPSENSNNEDELGILDYMANSEESFENMHNSMTKMTSQMVKFNLSMKSCTAQINDLNAKPDKTTARRTRRLVMGLAHDIDECTKSMSIENRTYAIESERAMESLEALLRSLDASSSEELHEFKDFLPKLDGYEEILERAYTEASKLIRVLREQPPIERTLTRARDRFIEQIRNSAANIQNTISAISRIKADGYMRFRNTKRP